MTHSQAIHEAVDQIDRLMKHRVGTTLGPGLSLALTTKDEPVAVRSYGVANADSGEPVTDRTLFQIGSITKHFTAAACMRLHERGKIAFDAPVTDYLPWFEVKSRFKTPVTIHHLLTHTAGLVMMIDSYPWSLWQTWLLRDTELGFEPGARHSYSNVGYNVLQCVIQKITGQSFDDALRELVFAPLGMQESYGEIQNGLHDRLAKGHKYSAHDDRPVPRPNKQTVVNWFEMSAGCASVVTTSTDLARFLRMLLRGGRADDGSSFLSAESFKTMTQPHAKMEGFFEGTTQGYGLLIERSEVTGGHPRVIGGGENLGFEATMYGDLDAGLGVIVFNNSFDVPWTETRWMLDTLLAASAGARLPEWTEKPGGSALSAEEAAAFVGSYRREGRSFNVEAADGGLCIKAGRKTAALERIWGDWFLTTHPAFDHAALTFGRDEEGHVVEAFQLGDWYRNGAYRGPETYETPQEWNTYVGRYRTFGVFLNSLKVFVRKGRLLVQSYGGYGESPLTDLGGGVFRAGDESSPERVRFDCIADGRALRCRASGSDYYRVE